MLNLKETAALLAVKECDLRADALHQCATSIDKGIHVGGAYSAIPPLAALYYGGFMSYRADEPAALDQDAFVLSKGHAVAALASLWADLGYIPRSALSGSRGWGALIKGHPGPVIPGVPVATGPLGHGIALAAGFALRRLESGAGRKSYCLVGDGELQEGSCWEALALAGDRRLSNLCVIVDKNDGQSDDTRRLLVGLGDLAARFESFGFRVLEADAGDPESLLLAFEAFAAGPRESRPTAIISRARKGQGGFSADTGKHKANFDAPALEKEGALLASARARAAAALGAFDPAVVGPLAARFGYRLEGGAGSPAGLARLDRPVPRKGKPAPRDKALRYNEAELPVLDSAKEYGAFEVITKTMAAFARDEKLYTVDADLSNASGLWDGARATNAAHALNVGIAECNMMCVGEALAAEGASVWTSTFAPFFDWRAFRRIAVGWQERAETIAEPDSWLSEGHNLDMAFIATAANLDTAVNGATHMANDDLLVYGQLAHLKTIDVCCPRQLLAVLRWIAEGNKGLVYLRVMRNKSRVLYNQDYAFEYGKGWLLRNSPAKKVAIVSSGHGVLEALAAADLLEKEKGLPAAVVDLPSFDGPLLESILKSGVPLLFAEQNNGALFAAFSDYALRNGLAVPAGRVLSLSAREADGSARFIQSGTYEQLVRELGLAPADIAEAAAALAGKASK